MTSCLGASVVAFCIEGLFRFSGMLVSVYLLEVAVDHERKLNKNIIFIFP